MLTNKRINPPKEIDIGDGQTVKVVDQFKLLGVTIDNKLNFEKYASLLNKKQSTKRCTFFLCQSVKLRFSKSFIMPHFDYCLTLFCYLPKSPLQKIYNTYNYTFLKLKSTNDANSFNKLLEN